MAILNEQSYSQNQDVRDAIATLIDNLPDGGEIGIHWSRWEETEQVCLVVVAFGPAAFVEVMKRMGITE